MPKTIAFRVDGNSKMGTGHFARCIALASKIRKTEANVALVTSSLSDAKFSSDPVWRSKVLEVPTGRQSHALIISSILKVGDAVVLDGYHFDEELEKELKSRGLKVATIDDNAERRFSSDWVLNGNVHALRLRYRTAKHTRRALGPKYFIFSNEVLSARKPRRFPVRVQKILVTMGGADPDNEAEKALRAIALLKDPDLDVTVVSGASNVHHDRIVRCAKTMPYRCTVLRSTSRIGELMSRADVGISSAGRVAAEMAFLGLPSLKIVLAENQLGLVKELHRQGAAINLGWRSRLTPKRIAARLRGLMDDVALRKKMSDKGRRLFDARGTERVAKILEELVR